MDLPNADLATMKRDPEGSPAQAEDYSNGLFVGRLEDMR